MHCNLVKSLSSKSLKLQVAKVFLLVKILNYMFLKLLDVTKNWIATVKFQDLSFTSILSTKVDYSPRYYLKIKELIAFGKTELSNSTYVLYLGKLNSLIQLMFYMYYWPISLRIDNLKYTAISQRISFNSFSLFYFFSYCCPFYYPFLNSHAQRNIMSIIYIAYIIQWVFAI